MLLRGTRCRVPVIVCLLVLLVRRYDQLVEKLGEPAVQADLKKLQRCIMMAKAHCLYQAGTEAKDYLSCIKECTVVLSTTEGVPELLR